MKQKGFTVVELMAVVVVIVLLAMIILVNYTSWQQRAATAEVKNDLEAAASAMESAKNFSSGYPTSQSAFQAIYTPSDHDVTLTLTSTSTTTYCVQGVSVSYSSIVYYVMPSTAGVPITTSC